MDRKGNMSACQKRREVWEIYAQFTARSPSKASLNCDLFILKCSKHTVGKCTLTSMYFRPVMFFWSYSNRLVVILAMLLLFNVQFTVRISSIFSCFHTNTQLKLVPLK